MTGFYTTLSNVLYNMPGMVVFMEYPIPATSLFFIATMLFYQNTWIIQTKREDF